MKLSGILEEIVESKRRELRYAKADRPVELLQEQVAELAPARDFAEALRGTDVALIAGGITDNNGETVFGESEIFDPSSDSDRTKDKIEATFYSTHNSADRAFHSAVPLNDGRVLLSGGIKFYKGSSQEAVNVYTPE